MKKAVQIPPLNTLIKPVLKMDVAQMVLDRLQSLLEQGILRPGSKLPNEPEMSRMLGVSRPSLRQAYKALNILGILRATPGDGTYISESTSRILSTPFTFLMLMRRINLDEIFEFRILLEGELARCAATRASAEEKEAMAAHIQNMNAHMQERDAYLTSEYAFHLCIAKAAHNALFLEIISILGGLLWETRKALYDVVNDRAADFEEHRAIFMAIHARDPDAAARAMRRHLSSALEQTKSDAFMKHKYVLE